VARFKVHGRYRDRRALVLEFLRLRIGLDWRLYDVLTREYEQDNPAGYALYMISMAIVVVIFQQDIALPRC